MKLFKVRAGTTARVMGPDRYEVRPTARDRTFEREEVVLDRAILHNRPDDWMSLWPELDVIDHMLLVSHVAAGDVVFGCRNDRGLWLLVVSESRVETI